VPEDVSVVGFDDIQSASFHVPRLTTVRQPLQAMGRAGADALLNKLAGKTLPHIIQVEPELIVRESTGPRHGHRLGASKRSKRLASVATK
jgi:LacI family transcriptional regulator